MALHYYYDNLVLTTIENEVSQHYVSNVKVEYLESHKLFHKLSLDIFIENLTLHYGELTFER